jgi:ABC-type multidrug transport system ATPase subunit
MVIPFLLIFRPKRKPLASSRVSTFSSFFRGYCQQLDTHVPEATVHEALMFSAKLRQPYSVPIAEKEA